MGFRPSDFDRLGPSVRRRPFLALLLPFCRDDVGISPVVVVVEMPLVRFDQSGHFVFEVGVAPPFLSVSFFGHEGILFALRTHRCARFPRSLACVGIPGVREERDERSKDRFHPMNTVREAS